MTTQTTDVQSTNQAHKSRLEHRSSGFEVLNFLTLSTMGKPKLAVAATILAGAVSVSGAQAKEGEQYALLGNENTDVSTQYEGGSVGREQMATTIEAQKERLIAQIEMGEKTCPTLKAEDTKEWRKCKKEQIAKPRLALLTLEEAEQAQVEKEIDEGHSELTQKNQKLSESVKQRKTNVVVLSEELADEKNKVAALKAIQKVAEEMAE